MIVRQMIISHVVLHSDCLWDVGLSRHSFPSYLIVLHTYTLLTQCSSGASLKQSDLLSVSTTWLVV